MQKNYIIVDEKTLKFFGYTLFLAPVSKKASKIREIALKGLEDTQTISSHYMDALRGLCGQSTTFWEQIDEKEAPQFAKFYLRMSCATIPKTQEWDAHQIHQILTEEKR